MDPLSKLTRALELARAAQSEAKKRTVQTNQQGPTRPTGAHRNAEGRELLRNRLLAVEGDSEESRSARVRLVIEYMLSREFGSEVVRSASMQQTLIDVQRVMDADPATHAEMDTLLASFKRESLSGS